MQQMQIVYDPECPVCDLYCKRCDLAHGTQLLINIRKPSEIMQRVAAASPNIDG